MKLFVHFLNIFLNIIVVCSSRGDIDPFDPSWMDEELYIESEVIK